MGSVGLRVAQMPSQLVKSFLLRIGFAGDLEVEAVKLSTIPASLSAVGVLRYRSIQRASNYSRFEVSFLELLQ